jgi:hypothetical protein
MLKKREDKENFYKLVHKEYFHLHKTGDPSTIRNLFRKAKDSYEQIYIYSLLTNDSFGIAKYIKSKDLFSVNKEKLDGNIERNIPFLTLVYNHYQQLDLSLYISSGGKYGYIYVLDNIGLIGLVKIGYTCGSAFGRAKQLSTTSVPYPFRVRYLARVRKPERVEKEVHALLDDKRVNNSREFFEVSIEQAIDAIESIATYLKMQDSSQRF